MQCQGGDPEDIGGECPEFDHWPQCMNGWGEHKVHGFWIGVILMNSKKSYCFSS
jgi:hypothetical protein